MTQRSSRVETRGITPFGPSRCWLCGGPHDPRADRKVTLYRKVSGGWGVVPPVLIRVGTYEIRTVVVPRCLDCRRQAYNEMGVSFVAGLLVLASPFAGAAAMAATGVIVLVVLAAVVAFVAAIALAIQMFRYVRKDDKPRMWPVNTPAIRHPAVKELLAADWALSETDADRVAAAHRSRR